jgi:hypothetical protein
MSFPGTMNGAGAPLSSTVRLLELAPFDVPQAVVALVQPRSTPFR